MSNLFDVDWSKLPAPADDGGADHLCGMQVPPIPLPATDGRAIDLSRVAGRSVVYAYPMTGRPGAALPAGWDMIPGARGCTPQACGFRDHYDELRRLGVSHVFGLSTQDTPYQNEAAVRLHLPFPLLSDARLQMADAMRLPTFTAQGQRLLRRLTLIVDDGRITHGLYPVFPPDRSAQDVIDWLTSTSR